jgi:hypothetical protein
VSVVSYPQALVVVLLQGICEVSFAAPAAAAAVVASWGKFHRIWRHQLSIISTATTVSCSLSSSGAATATNQSRDLQSLIARLSVNLPSGFAAASEKYSNCVLMYDRKAGVG